LIHRLLRFARGVDRVNVAIGRSASLLALAMVLLGSWNALARYLGRFIGYDLSSNAFIEGQWYMFSLMFLLGGAWTLQRNEHVRVDVLYGRASARTKAWIDILGTTFFLLPFCVWAIWMSWPAVRNSWSVLEMSADPGGLPRYPLKTVIPIAFALVALQGVAWIIQKVAFLRGVEVPTNGDPTDG
jgi:TRAP-type mannitol/chloroaromatic compound transport system permease small subunit